MKRLISLFALIGAALAQESQPAKSLPDPKDAEIATLKREITAYQQAAFGCMAAQIEAQAKAAK